MIEIFKWLACHPDVTLTFKYMDMYYTDGDLGNLVMTMSSSHPFHHYKDALKHQKVVSIDLIVAAHCDDYDLVIDILDTTYKELIREKSKIITDAMVKAKEVPNGHKE